jgi:hypothetical protein
MVSEEKRGNRRIAQGSCTKKAAQIRSGATAGVAVSRSLGKRSGRSKQFNSPEYVE